MWPNSHEGSVAKARRRKVSIIIALAYDTMIVNLSGRLPQGYPARNLPTVSNPLNKAMMKRAYQLPEFSTWEKKFILTSSDTPGNTIKVTMKTTARPTRNYHEILKLFNIIMKNALIGEM